MSEQDRDRTEQDGPVVRDKRRIDPVTGALREPAPTQGAAPAPGAGPDAPHAGPDAPHAGPDAPDPTQSEDPAQVELDDVRRELTERTVDLQRLQAEYVNYRRRVDRDRDLVREQSRAGVLVELLPVLDDIGRAREHGQLEGAFGGIATALETVLGKLGLERFGEAGDAFDPTVHEALLHDYSEEVTEPTAVAVLQPGYRVGDRVVRPARVAVAEPAPASAPQPTPTPTEQDE